MPRPEPPPTPGSSAEIRGKDGSKFSSLQMSFELPPPAVVGTQSRPSSASTKSSSASSYHPTSPISPTIPASEVVKIRRRSSVAQSPAKDAFALPPPPTRSRKIIQMKPRGQPEEKMDSLVDETKSGAGKPTPAALAKKKQPSSNSVAGRKIARKTAHSLIERRRRSKMNEEFGVLKDMIPACTGEMHKLAILQASIDYVRYLEDCVTKLKAENSRASISSTSTSAHHETFMLPPSLRQTYPPSSNSNSNHTSYPEEEDEDISMLDPSCSTTRSQTPLPSISPALLPFDTSSPALSSKNRQNSYSSISSNTATHHSHHSTQTQTRDRHYSFSNSASNSTTTSPALLPGNYSKYEYARSEATGSALTSPALRPVGEREADRYGDELVQKQNATAALLMLNSDRRGTGGEEPRGREERRGGETRGNERARGMSVKDLLST